MLKDEREIKEKADSARMKINDQRQEKTRARHLEENVEAVLAISSTEW